MRRESNNDLRNSSQPNKSGSQGGASRTKLRLSSEQRKNSPLKRPDVITAKLTSLSKRDNPAVVISIGGVANSGEMRSAGLPKAAQKVGGGLEVVKSKFGRNKVHTIEEEEKTPKKGDVYLKPPNRRRMVTKRVTKRAY